MFDKAWNGNTTALSLQKPSYSISQWRKPKWVKVLVYCVILQEKGALNCTLHFEHCQTRLTCLPGPHQGPHIGEAEHQGLGQPLASADHLDNQSEVSIDDVDQSEVSIHNVDQSEVSNTSTQAGPPSPGRLKSTPPYRRLGDIWAGPWFLIYFCCFILFHCSVCSLLSTT